jgi:phosphoglycolate phosphatase-like HAD superfamily hydrolase
LVLERFHLVQEFAFVVGYSPKRQPKPSGDPIFEAKKHLPSLSSADLVYIGDSLQDPLTAKNGGIAGILLERNHEYPDYPETKISTLAALEPSLG